MMDHAIWFLPQAYPIEVLQLVASVFGSVFNVWGVFDARRDLKFWKFTGTSLRELTVAKRNLFEELMRLIVLMLFVFNGIVSITHAPPNPGLGKDDDRYYQLFISRTVMTVASMLLAAKSMRDIRDRKRIRALAIAGDVEILEVIKDKAVDIVHVIDETKKTKEGKKS